MTTDIRLSDEEEADLWHKAQSGSKSARDDLVASCYGLARKVAQKYQGNGIDLDDLEQVACLELCLAVDRWQPDRGSRFSTYAYRCVAGACAREVADRSQLVRIPRERYSAGLKARAAVDTAPMGTTSATIAARLEMSRDELLALLADEHTYSAFTEPVTGSAEPLTLADVLAGPPDPDPVEVADYLSCLTELERRCFCLRYGIYDGRERSVSEVARRTQQTFYYADKAINAALAKLTHPAVLKALAA